MGKPTDAIESVRVQDPMLSDAQFYHDKATKPGDPTVGTVWVQRNMVTLIGGLALVRRALAHHKQAAAWFKRSYEDLYGGMPPAPDLSKVRVDTSIMARDNGAAGRIDRGAELIAVIFGTRDSPALFSKSATERLVAVLVLGIPCGDFAPCGPSGKPSGRAVEREVDMLLAHLDKLAKHRRMAMTERAA